MLLQRRLVVEYLAIEEVTQSTGIRSLESLNTCSVHLSYAFSTQDDTVHHYQYTLTLRFRSHSSNYRIVKIQRTISADSCRRTHSTYQYYRLVALYSQVQEISSFFHSVSSVSNHDTVYFRLSQQFVNSLRQDQPNFIVHILRTDTNHLFTCTVCNVLQFRNCIKQCTDSYLTSCVVSSSRRSTRTCDSTTSCKNVNVRLLSERHSCRNQHCNYKESHFLQCFHNEFRF